MATELKQKSVYEGTFSDTLVESAVGTLLLIPDFNGDECEVCGEAFSDDFLWKCGVKLVTRNLVRLVDGMFKPVLLTKQFVLIIS